MKDDAPPGAVVDKCFVRRELTASDLLCRAFSSLGS